LIPPNFLPFNPARDIGQPHELTAYERDGPNLIIKYTGAIHTIYTNHFNGQNTINNKPCYDHSSHEIKQQPPK
jgi:hypothetical protein